MLAGAASITAAARRRRRPRPPAPVGRRAARPAAVFSRQRHGGRLAEASAAELLGRAVLEKQLLNRPPRRGAAVSRAHARVVRSGGADGRGHPRVRRDLHQGSPAGLPPRAERSAHHHEHPGDAARRQVHEAVHAGRHRAQRHAHAAGHGGVPHQRYHARRVQDAARQDGRLRPARVDAAAVPRRHGEFPYRPLRRPDERRAADARREHRAVQEARHRHDPRAEGAERDDAVQRLHAGSSTRRR